MNNLLARCSHLFPSLRKAWYAIPLRLIVGYGFMEHGYAKLARGPDSFAGILHALGMPAPMLLSWTTVIVELLGGLAVFVGAFVPLASVPMAFVLLVATFTVHLPNGFSSIKLQSVTADGAHFGQPGYETDLLYLAGLAALVLGGSGPLALDRFFVRRTGEMGRTLSDQNPLKSWERGHRADVSARGSPWSAFRCGAAQGARDTNRLSSTRTVRSRLGFVMSAQKSQS